MDPRLAPEQPAGNLADGEPTRRLGPLIGKLKHESRPVRRFRIMPGWLLKECWRRLHVPG